MNNHQITEDELVKLINEDYKKMNEEEKYLWKEIKIQPVKWNQKPYGDSVNGFWVVGLLGKNVIWYNEIEEGFNESTYEIYGSIKEYFANQDQLNWVVHNILNRINNKNS